MAAPKKLRLKKPRPKRHALTKHERKKLAPKKHGARKDRRSWLRRVGTWLGIAGVLGVAAGGVLVARDVRQRRAYTPDEVRRRLHDRAGLSGP